MFAFFSYLCYNVFRRSSMVKHDTLMKVFEYIRYYNDENGYPPSVRDICTALGIKSTASAYGYINRLQEQGYLDKAPGKKRSVVIRGSSAVPPPLPSKSFFAESLKWPALISPSQ